MTISRQFVVASIFLVFMLDFFYFFTTMLSNDYPIKTHFKYSRRTYREQGIGQTHAPYSDTTPADSIDDLLPPCKGPCGIESEVLVEDNQGSCCDGDVANILHKKCLVIDLAQQQMRRLLDETDRILGDGTLHTGPSSEIICAIRRILKNHHACYCILVAMIATTFWIGLVLGAATCGSWLRRFNSPILTCLNNMFIPDTYKNPEDAYRSVV